MTRAATKTPAAKKTAAAKPTPAPTASSYAAGSFVRVAPGQLLLQRNIRDAKPGPEFVASVKDLGVLQPITAVLNTDGALVVRFGHRRAVAAVEAGCATVPVYIAGDDDTADQAEVDRIIRQHDENTHRDGLSAADNIGVYEQLTAFGLSADQVATRTRVKRDVVNTALKVSGSKVARAAAAKYEALTLDQAATVAEFDHDPEIVKNLVVVAVQEPERFAHVAQTARDAVLLENRRQQLLHKLGQEQVLVVEAPDHYNPGKTKAALDRLSAKGDGKELTVAAHKTCPGHVAWLTTKREWVDAEGTPVQKVDHAAGHRLIDTWAPVYGCKDPKKHGHQDIYGSYSSAKPAAADLSDAEREKAKKERRLVIDNNKAWDSATVVRLEWLAEFAGRKTAPKGTAAFVANAIAADRSIFGDAVEARGKLCIEWGLPMAKVGYHQVVSVPDQMSDARALVVLAAEVLAAYEAESDRMDWRRNGKTERHGRYLRFLESAGYGLSDVEKFALTSKTV